MEPDEGGGGTGGGSDRRIASPATARTMALLDLVRRHPAGLTLAEIVRQLGLALNTAQRIVATLVQEGYLERDAESRRHTLSRRMLAFGGLETREGSLVALVLDAMRGLRDATRETALVGTLTDDAGIVLELLPGLHHFRFDADIGCTMPLHCAAPCKAILALLPEDEREARLAEMPFTRYNDRTITDVAAFRAHLAGIRENGVAFDRCEQFDGVFCVAAPVLDRLAYPVAALWVTGPADRLQPQEAAVAGAVRRFGREASRCLGHRDDSASTLGDRRPA